MSFDKALIRRRILSLTVCVAMCAAFLSSCGNHDGSDSSEQTTAVTTPPSLTVTTAGEKAVTDQETETETFTDTSSLTVSENAETSAVTSGGPSGTKKTSGTSAAAKTTSKTASSGTASVAASSVGSSSAATSGGKSSMTSSRTATTSGTTLLTSQKEGNGFPEAIDSAEYLIGRLNSNRLRNAARSVIADIRAGKKEIAIADGTVKESELSDFVGFVSMLEAESYIIPSSYVYTVNKSGFVTKLKITEYPKTPGQYRKEKQAVEDLADKIVAEAERSCATQFDKALFFHDYIIDHCVYDQGAANGASAYGCLIEGRAVCEGYAKAMQVLCSRAGIESVPVTGYVLSGGNTQSHIWNIVNIDGTWTHIDATWDDIENSAVSACSYSYFGLTDAEIAIDHTVTPLSILSLPQATSTSASYYVRRGYYINSEQRIAEILEKAITEAVESSSVTVTVRCASEELYIAASDMARSGEYEYGYTMELIKKAKDKLGSDVSVSEGFLLGDSPNAKGTHTIIIFLRYDI